ncbi:MAG TPA: amino acid deaminase/aldolase, partial [Phototrophicaceae bacterium]|nr:amino acid deaminase/aldolase [Phototrophicaceae bacterium]
MYQKYRTIFHGKPMPFAYVDLDLLDANIQQILKRSQGMPIRVASKSVRCVAILKRIFAANPAFQGVMCYTPSEAVYLSKHGFDDLLVAYPCWHESQITAVCEQIRAGKSITLMVDSIEHIQHLETLAARHDVTLSLCLDIDLSMDLPGLHFGVWRSSIFTVKDALNVADAIIGSPHLRLDGIMGYEAQIAGLGDKNGGARSAVIRLLKRRSIPQIAERRKAIVEALKTRGVTLRFVNGGGTGSVESTIREDAVTEVTVGSGFYAPGLFDHYQAFKHQPAAGFAIEIVRHPKPEIYTCLGGGYIASGSTDKVKQPVPYLPVGAKLTDLEGAGEVQTPVVYQGSEKLSLGDPVFLRHSKAGELCEHFNQLYLISQGQIVDQVPTYRGEG